MEGGVGMGVGTGMEGRVGRRKGVRMAGGGEGGEGLGMEKRVASGKG